jgi:protein-S-isoprenylcysteine O-methyltransferase Ste14
MKATDWEFTYRALIFGLIIGCCFPLYAFDPQNASTALATWLGHGLRLAANLIARLLVALGALLLVLAAFLRTWASAYLHAGVVYASEVKNQRLVADGPYRQVRNPLYFANVLMAISMGAMMSRLGFLVAVAATAVFCYRLILREEAALHSGPSEYQSYCKAVPRFWPALAPRIASSGRPANWRDGFKAETWFWGFALAVTAFAITLSFPLFLVILGASLVWFWLSSTWLRRESGL